MALIDDINYDMSRIKSKSKWNDGLHAHTRARTRASNLKPNTRATLPQAHTTHTRTYTKLAPTNCVHKSSVLPGTNHSFVFCATVKELAESHKNHLLPQFMPDEKEEQTIEILTEHITKVTSKMQLQLP